MHWNAGVNYGPCSCMENEGLSGSYVVTKFRQIQSDAACLPMQCTALSLWTHVWLQAVTCTTTCTTSKRTHFSLPSVVQTKPRWLPHGMTVDMLSSHALLRASGMAGFVVVVCVCMCVGMMPDLPFFWPSCLCALGVFWPGANSIQDVSRVRVKSPFQACSNRRSVFVKHFTEYFRCQYVKAVALACDWSSRMTATFRCPLYYVYAVQKDRNLSCPCALAHNEGKARKGGNGS